MKNPELHPSTDTGKGLPFSVHLPRWAKKGNEIKERWPLSFYNKKEQRRRLFPDPTDMSQYVGNAIIDVLEDPTRYEGALMEEGKPLAHLITPRGSTTPHLVTGEDLRLPDGTILPFGSILEPSEKFLEAIKALQAETQRKILKIEEVKEALKRDGIPPTPRTAYRGKLPLYYYLKQRLFLEGLQHSLQEGVPAISSQDVSRVVEAFGAQERASISKIPQTLFLLLGLESCILYATVIKRHMKGITNLSSMDITIIVAIFAPLAFASGIVIKDFFKDLQELKETLERREASLREEILPQIHRVIDQALKKLPETKERT